MATVVDSLLITLGLDNSGVDKGMRQAESRINAGAKSLASSLTSILAPLVGAAGFGALLNNFVQTGQELAKLSQKLRMDASDIQAWGDAVTEAGGDANGLRTTLAGIEEKLKMAQLGRWSGELQYMTGSVRDANGQLKTSGQVLMDLAKKADTMDPNRFRYIAKRLGVDDGTILLMQKGSKEVEKLVAEYKELALTQKDAETAKKFGIEQNKLIKTFQALGNIVIRAILPAITKFSEALRGPVNFIRDHDKFVLAFFGTLATIMTVKLLPAILKVTAALLANPLTWVAAAILAIALVIDDLWTYATGGESALADLWSQFGTGEEIAQTLQKTWENLKATGQAVWETMMSSAKWFFENFGGLVDPLITIVDGMLATIKAIFEGDFEAIGKGIRKIFKGVVDYFIELVKSSFKVITDAVNGVMNFFSNGDEKSAEKEYKPGRFQSFLSGLFNDEDDNKAGPVGKVVNDRRATEAIKANAALMASSHASSSVDNSQETTINGVVINVDGAQSPYDTGNEVRNVLTGGAISGNNQGM